MKEALSKILDVVGKILAIILVFAFLLFYINKNYNFLGKVPVLETIINFIHAWGAFILAAIVAMEAIIKAHFVFTIIMLLLIVAVAVFMCLPGAIESLLPASGSGTTPEPESVAAVLAIL